MHTADQAAEDELAPLLDRALNRDGHLLAERLPQLLVGPLAQDVDLVLERPGHLLAAGQGTEVQRLVAQRRHADEAGRDGHRSFLSRSGGLPHGIPPDTSLCRLAPELVA